MKQYLRSAALLAYSVTMLIAMTFFAPSAQAAVTIFSAVPTAWRIENYIGDSVMIWFSGITVSGPSCPGSQGVQMPLNATKADRDRLYSTVVAAKIAKQTMFIQYESTNCTLISFGLLEQPN